MINATIDGKTIQVEEGATVLEAAKKLGISIPTLCHHPKITPIGSCRLCIVEIKGISSPVTSCTTPLTEGMEVTTSSPLIDSMRKHTLDLILSDHPLDCPCCIRGGDCQLQDVAFLYGPNPGETMFNVERRESRIVDVNPFLLRDIDKCIRCGRCSKICEEVQGVGVTFPPDEHPLNCEFCGQCVSVCPTGALAGKMWIRKDKSREEKTVDTVCPYCGTGCQITLHIQHNKIIRVTSKDDTWNKGLLCVTGRFGYKFVNSPERLTKPLIKRNGQFEEVSWEEAYDYTANKLNEIKAAHGSHAIGGLSSARCTNEENYAFQKMIRAAVGTNNVDQGAPVTSLAPIFGSGAMTNSIEEIEGMEVILIIGSNTKETHPVIANSMIKAYRKGAKIIVADPLHVPMTKFADIVLRLKPGTDIALVNGIAHVIIKEGLENKAFIGEKTEGFEAWKNSVEEYTPEYVEKITGVSREDIIKASRTYGSSQKAGIFYTMGITQHNGADNIAAVANLVTLTGNIGRESTGINPLRGQNNVQGASDAACLPNVLPGYQKLDNPDVIAKFEEAWGVSIPGKPGLTATQMIHSALDGKIKALYIMGENPVITDPNTHHTIESLKKLDFLVVQDIFMTETAKLADVVLPSSCFAEKDGTFTNTARKVQRVRKAVEPPGEARTDLTIIMELSRRLGYAMDYKSPADVLAEFGQVWPDLAGITYKRIETQGLQWPCTDNEHPGTPYLYSSGFPVGKIRFSIIPYVSPAEVTDNEYPFIMATGKNLFQYHSWSMTRRVPAIESYAGEPYVEISPEDSKKLRVEDGDALTVNSRHGSIRLKAKVTSKVAEGVVFLPMHSGEAAANMITNDALDGKAEIPEFEVCAVKIEKR